jgi:transcriptional regulator with XRE-family HTH domain
MQTETGPRLRRLKIALHNQLPRMSQAELARRLGIGEGTVSRYVRGAEVPPDRFFTRAAEVLGVPEDEIREPELVA